jgi:hypothetical protein
MYLLLLWLIPFTHATTAPNCVELSRIVTELEKDFMQQEFKNCRGVTTQGMENPGAIEHETVEENKCRSLGSIVTNIQQLENEQSVLEGFKKLKADLLTYKTNAGASNQQSAQQAGKNFVDVLVTAQSLEALMAAKTKEGAPLLVGLKSVNQDNRDSVAKMKAAVDGLCQSNANTKDACQEGVFEPNQQAITEINGLLNGDLSAAEVERWRSEFAIKKASDQSDYSFLDMRTTLKSSLGDLERGQPRLTRQQLKAIHELPDFSNASEGSLNQKINQAKAAMAPQLRMEQFKFLLEDARERQQLEIQSKVSLLYSSFFNNSSHLSPQEKESCLAARESFEDAVNCSGSMQNNQNKIGNNTHQQRLQETLAAIECSRNYRDRLVTSSRECVNPEVLSAAKLSGSLPEACSESFSQQGEKLALQLRALKHLREKLIEQNQRTADFRDFAQQKMYEMNCFSTALESNIQCDGDMLIAPEALLLTSQTMDVSLVLSKPALSKSTDIIAHCESAKTRQERLLCAFGSGEGPSDIIETKNDPHEYQAPLRADSRHNPVREAQLMALNRLARDIAGSLAPRPLAQNPYNYHQGLGRGGPVTPLAGQIRMGAYQQEHSYQASRYFNPGR